MAGNQKKATQQRPKRNRFLACFGISSKTASKSDKKCNKTGGSSESWLKLCMPKIKIIIIRRRKGKGKGSFDGKTVDALKAYQSIIKLEANNTKIQQEVKKSKEVVTNDAIPVIQSDLQSIRGHESDESREQMPISRVKKGDDGNNNYKVRKDSLIGVSMMVITLIIMGFWGYLYAIICMSAWLYCLPLFKMYKDGDRLPNNVMGSLKPKMASKLYKKKTAIQRVDNGIAVS